MTNDLMRLEARRRRVRLPSWGVNAISNEKKTYEPAVCGHCGGEGCIYCNKTGAVLVTAPKRACRHCEGVGCIYCGFTGWAEPKGKYD